MCPCFRFSEVCFTRLRRAGPIIENREKVVSCELREREKKVKSGEKYKKNTSLKYRKVAPSGADNREPEDIKCKI
jgi:hypothetical protein